MKHKQKYSYLCIVVIIIYSGCSIPTMLLKHENQIDNTYERKGSVKIEMFTDNRLDEERDEDRIAANTLAPQIWSGATNPEMMLFFQNSLIEEAERTHLFEVNDKAEYVLSGYVTSMKVERQVSYWYYVGVLPISIGILTSERGNYTNLGIGAAVSFLLLSVSTQIFTATVEFHAILMKNGSNIFEKDIRVIKENEYSLMFDTWQDCSDKASNVFDQTIAESISVLFEEIASEI